MRIGAKHSFSIVFADAALPGRWITVMTVHDGARFDARETAALNRLAEAS